MADNPLYSMSPTTPPGWQGVPYMLGPIVADMTGGVAAPYVPPNMATYDATVVSQVNNPLYKTMMGRVYDQLGTQVGNTAGAMKFVQGIGTMAGYTPEQTKKALSGGMGAFSRSAIGSFVMPFVDSGLNSLGVTGGSFVAAGQEAFNARMNLMGPGALINPYDAGQQHKAMAAASATAMMLNEVVSQRENGKLLATVDQSVTQGFSRERVAQLAMRAAGRGMFTSNAAQGFDDVKGTGVGGIADRLSQAVGDASIDLSRLSMDNFDGKASGIVQKSDAAESVKRVKDEFRRGVQSLTEAMGAMRDLTGFVDEELEKLLDDATNGDWSRSANGAFAARDAIRTLHAASQAYNIDPKQALAQIRSNRLTLQQAAGFDENMRYFGFSGGGMFGLSAQTELFTNIEDMINARGVRGDPILSDRIRKQSVQAMARNENSTAGKAAQILAYARQTGVVSEADAERYAALLTSGDSSLMADGLNRLLTTQFGSAEAGRRFMNDTMQMNAMRMAMDDRAGRFATALTMNGADAEYHRREQVSAASQRLAFTQQALSESGMNTWQSAEGTGKVVENIVKTIRGDGKDADRVADAAAFQQQYDAMLAKGMDARTAASTLVSAYKRSPVTSQYSQEIDLAIKQQAAVNNEEALMHGGKESRQATALVRELTARRSIDGKESAEIYKMIREGHGAEALARVDRKVGGLDSATQQQMRRIREDAAQKHDAAVKTMQDNVEVTELIGLVSGRGFSGEDVAKAYETMANAGMRYASSKKEAEDYDRFWESVSKTNFVGMFGEKALKEYMTAVQSGDTDYLSKMGRRAGAVRRTAISTLGKSGFGLEMSGYWGGGASSVNSEEIRKKRDTLINGIASRMNESAFVDAKERDTLAANIVDFMTGNKDWKSLLKVYDKDDAAGLQSSLAKYGAAFKKYQEAQEAFGGKQEAYNKALGELGKEGAYTAMEAIEAQFRSGGEISHKWLRKQLGGVKNKDAVSAIVEAAEAHNNVVRAQRTSEDVLGETVADEKAARGLKGLVSWDAVRKQRNAKITGDEKVKSFIDNFDFSADGLKEAKGASREFLKKMFDTVSDEEVAARVGVDVKKGVKHKYGEAAMAIIRERAEKGDEKALAVMRAARTAQRDAATRIHGEITIRSGFSASPAVLEGNVGGL